MFFFLGFSFVFHFPTWKVDLFAATPSNIPAESFEVYGVALALVAQAFVGKKPHLIQDADNLFQQLQQTKVRALGNTVNVYTSDQNREIDFSLERGLCSLLVGELDECRSWLGLDNDNSPYRNPSVIDFVVENSKDDDDNDLPGLCKLLETWLSEVVFPRFRDTKDVQFKLGDYYDDPTVLRYLERLDGASGSPLAAAAAIVRIGAEATAVIGHVKASALKALQKAFPLSQRDENITHKEDGEMNQSPLPLEEGGEPFEEPGLDDFSHVAEISGRDGSDELRDELLITDKIKDASVKIMCAGGVIGLITLFGLRYLPTRNSSSILRKQLGSPKASNVTDLGMI